MKKNILAAIIIMFLSLVMVTGTTTISFADEVIEEVEELSNDQDAAEDSENADTDNTEDAADEAENTSDDDQEEAKEVSDNQTSEQEVEQANATDSDDNTADEAGQAEVAAPVEAEENIQELSSSDENVIEVVTEITDSSEGEKSNTGEKVMNDNSFGFGVLPTPVVEEPETQPETTPVVEEPETQPETTPVVETPENPQPENPTPVVETPVQPEKPHHTSNGGNGGGVILHPVTIIEFPEAEEIEEAPEMDEQLDEGEIQAPVQPEVPQIWESPEVPNRGLVQTGDNEFAKMMLNAILCVLSLIVFVVSMFSKATAEKTSVNVNDKNNENKNMAEVVKTTRQMYGIPYIVSGNQFEKEGELFNNGNLLLKSSWVTFPSPQNVMR